MNIVVFESALGWMGAALARCTLQRLVWGRSSPGAALAALEMPDAGQLAGDPEDAQVELIDRLKNYADGAEDDFADVRLDLGYLAEFGRRVIRHCRRIPAGETLSYGELAAKAGSPRAARAVGNVMKSNRFPLIVPCHRVIGAGGAIGGYSAPDGIRLKRKLLAREGVDL